MSAIKGLHGFIMALSAGYLTARQKQIWTLQRKGLIEADIGRWLKVTRQTVHKAVNIANDKVSRALLETAQLNRIKVRSLDPTEGILIGHSPAFKTTAIITFSARNGIQVWYKAEEHCESCDQLERCREILLAEAEERGVQLPENKDWMLPSELAEVLFSNIMGE